MCTACTHKHAHAGREGAEELDKTGQGSFSYHQAGNEGQGSDAGKISNCMQSRRRALPMRHGTPWDSLGSRAMRVRTLQQIRLWGLASSFEQHTFFSWFAVE